MPDAERPDNGQVAHPERAPEALRRAEPVQAAEPEPRLAPPLQAQRRLALAIQAEQWSKSTVRAHDESQIEAAKYCRRVGE